MDNTAVKTSGRCTAQLAKMSIDPKFFERAADVFKTFLESSHWFSARFFGTYMRDLFLDCIDVWVS